MKRITFILAVSGLVLLSLVELSFIIILIVGFIFNGANNINLAALAPTTIILYFIWIKLYHIVEHSYEAYKKEEETNIDFTVL